MGLYPEPVLADAARTPVSHGLFVDFNRNDDFGTVAAGTTSDGGGAFIFSTVSSGTFTRPSTQPYAGGWARLSGAATTDDSGGSIQTRDVFSLGTTNKTITFKARAVLNETTSTNIATESDVFLGLAVMDTTVIAGVTDGFYFLKGDGGTTLSAVMIVGSSATTTTVTNSSGSVTFDKSVHTFGIEVQITSISSTTPTGNVAFHYDGGSANGGSTVRLTSVTLPATTVFLAATAAFQTGDNTGTKWLDIDYIGGWQLR